MKIRQICTLLLAVASTPALLGAEESVLTRLENYDAPRFPADSVVTREAYDARMPRVDRVPASLTDTFVCDLVTVMVKILDLRGVSIGGLREDHIRRAFQAFLQRDWTKVPGYRPWTHWNFVNGLTDRDREQLMREVASYTRTKRVACPE
jgi:hypothetical protein